MRSVKKEINEIARNHDKRLHKYSNVELFQLLDNHDLARQLKRTKSFELA